MTRATRGLTLAALALSFGSGDKALSSPCGPRVLTAKDLQEAGITRLSGILSLIDDWDASTLDGFSHRISARGQAPYQRQDWIVMVDGQVLRVGVFDAASLNEIPIAVGQIDSVEIHGSPGIVAGRFSEAGLIHFHLTRHETGSEARATFSTGNETGDPGPFLFTEHRSPNIDRTGPDYAVGFGSGTKGWNVVGGAKFLQEPATDPDVRQRNQLYGVFPMLDLKASLLRAGYSTARARHELLAGYTSFENYLFIQPYGREIPTVQHLIHAGIDGHFSLGPALQLRYRSSLSSTRSERRPKTSAPALDWGMRSWTADLELRRSSGNVGLTAGLTVQGEHAVTGSELSRDSQTLGAVYLSAAHSPGGTHRQVLDTWLSAARGACAVKTAFRHRWWRPGSRHALEAVFGYSERLVEEDSRIWNWWRRGYRFLDDQGVAVTFPATTPKPRSWRADLTWSWRVLEQARFDLTGYARALGAELLETRDYRFRSESHSFSGPVEVVADQSAWLGGGLIVLEIEPARHMACRTAYRYQNVLGGDVTARRAWDPVAHHHFRQSLTVRSVENLTLQTMLEHRGPTFWPDYRDALSDTNGAYSPRVPGWWKLDLVIQKWLWERRLRASMNLQNLLNDEVRYHPIGATFDLSLFVLLELRLPPQPPPTVR